MTITSDPHTSTAQRGRRTWLWVVLAVLATGAVVLAVAVVMAVLAASRPIPEFASLADAPDASIQGTVAYVDDDACIQVVAAAGQPSLQVYCLPPMDVKVAEAIGKELGPQLVWLPDGRLEVTMFRMPATPGPELDPGWQKVVDVRTGEVVDVPDAQAPSEPNLDTHPTVSPSGDEVTFTSEEDGTVTVLLHRADGATRTVLEAQGPANHAYSLGAVFWSPGWDWIAADDGRILVIVPTDPAVTRVLATPGDFGFGPEYARFAITAQNVLAPAG